MKLKHTKKEQETNRENAINFRLATFASTLKTNKIYKQNQKKQRKVVIKS